MTVRVAPDVARKLWVFARWRGEQAGDVVAAALKVHMSGFTIDDQAARKARRSTPDASAIAGSVEPPAGGGVAQDAA